MEMKILAWGLIALLWTGCSQNKTKTQDNGPVYEVVRAVKPVMIDGRWEKPEWQNISAVEITNMMGEKPLFTPATKAKMQYDDDYLYVIFHVDDRYVRCVVTEIDGPVYNESAVEFFFSPDPEFADGYFNLEINCGGTPLMRYNIYDTPDKRNSTVLALEDIRKVEIAHSLPEVVDPEISEPVTWTLEYRIPIEILRRHSKVLHPKPGVEWKANFFKVSGKGTNAHFLTWSPVEYPIPKFHLPQFFGTLRFK